MIRTKTEHNYASLGIREVFNNRTKMISNWKKMTEGLGEGKDLMVTQIVANDGDKPVPGFDDNFNNDLLRKGEFGSAGNHSSGRGMAKLGAYMANRGSLNGKTLMSETTWEEFHSEPDFTCEAPFGLRSGFTKGGVALWGLDGI
jgi:hypothetical protein